MITSGYPSIIAYQRIAGSALESTITGKAYKDSRPTSGAEDVVINLINLTAEQFQHAVGNINIYVPDLQISQTGTTVYVANDTRLDELETLAIALFEEYHSQAYSFWIENSKRLEEPETKSHYVNLRIGYRFNPI